MLDVIFIIVICVILLSGIGDIFFKLLGFTAKIILGVILILSCIFLLIKTTIIITPIILYLILIIGVIWLLRTIFSK